MRVAPVHGVRTRSERLALAAPIRGVPGVLPVNNVRGDGEDRLRVRRIPVGRELPDLLHEGFHQVHCDVVHPVIVIAELGEVALDQVVNDDPVVVPDRGDLRVLDG